MAQLIERGTRDHVANRFEPTVSSHAVGFFSHSQPKLPARFFHACRKTAIVDDLSADRFEAARLLQRLGMEQHASSCSAGYASARIRDWLRRIQQEKEI